MDAYDAIERLSAANDRYWSEHSLGGTVCFDQDEERQNWQELHGYHRQTDDIGGNENG